MEDARAHTHRFVSHASVPPGRLFASLTRTRRKYPRSTLYQGPPVPPNSQAQLKYLQLRAPPSLAPVLAPSPTTRTHSFCDMGCCAAALLEAVEQRLPFHPSVSDLRVASSVQASPKQTRLSPARENRRARRDTCMNARTFTPHH